MRTKPPDEPFALLTCLGGPSAVLVPCPVPAGPWCPVDTWGGRRALPALQDAAGRERLGEAGRALGPRLGGGPVGGLGLWGLEFPPAFLSSLRESGGFLRPAYVLMLTR